MVGITTVDGVPVLQRNREISFDDNTLEKLRYLNYKAGKQGYDLKERFSLIVNEALREFFEVKFKELKIEHYVNEVYEGNKRRNKERMKEEARASEDLRLLKLAKMKIIEDAIEAIKKEEKKTGIKKQPPADLKRRYFKF